MPRNVLFLSHDSSLYGAQVSLLGLLQALDTARLQPHVIAPSRGALTERLEALGIPVSMTPLRHWIPPRNMRGPGHALGFVRTAPRRVGTLSSMIRSLDIDLVYTNTVTCIDGALASLATGRPHIWHLREHVRGNEQLTSYLPAWAVPPLVRSLSARVIVNSHALRGSLFGRLRPGRVRVVHNGVDLASFTPIGTRSPLRGELGLPDSTRVVSAVGSIIRRKGLETFVRAAARVKEGHGDTVFLIAGEGDRRYEQELRRLVDASGLRDSCRFLGWRPDIAEILRATDVLVSAAEQEAFGRTIIEAMATARPVVATRSGGPEEIVIDGETGFLVPPGDPTALGAAIVRLLEDPLTARAFGAAGRGRAERFFSLAAHARAIGTIIDEVLSEA